MCKFFSCVTDPDTTPRRVYYLDWEYRQENLFADDADSHSHICEYYGLNEDQCNKYEYNPLTQEFTVDQINADYHDGLFVEEYLNKLDFSKVVAPLIIKPIVSPLQIPYLGNPENLLGYLYEWDSVGASVWDSVGASVGASVMDNVGTSVMDNVGTSVMDNVGISVRASVWDSVWAYISTFFSITYEHDFSVIRSVWDKGVVPSYDGEIWRLHTGQNAEIIYEISQRELFEMFQE